MRDSLPTHHYSNVFSSSLLFALASSSFLMQFHCLLNLSSPWQRAQLLQEGNGYFGSEMELGGQREQTWVESVFLQGFHSIAVRDQTATASFNTIIKLLCLLITKMSIYFSVINPNVVGFFFKKIISCYSSHFHSKRKYKLLS